MKQDEIEIPVDMLFDILSRLPVKALGRARCVSKAWNSIISDGRFIKSHLNRSLLARRSAAAAAAASANLIVSSSNPMHARRSEVKIIHGKVSQSLNGLICIHEARSPNYRVKVTNPTTGEVINLPGLEEFAPATRGASGLTFFGYDPINNQHKVLAMLYIRTGPSKKLCIQSFVFVIGGDSWRRISHEHLRHFPIIGIGVCINGILYYTAEIYICNNCIAVVVAFDVRLETFRSIEMPPWGSDGYACHYRLMQFGRQLAIVNYKHLNRANNVYLWVLEDSLEPNWIHKDVVFPTVWVDIIREYRVLYFAGIGQSGEIIMAPKNLSAPFDLFYLNFEVASVIRA